MLNMRFFTVDSPEIKKYTGLDDDETMYIKCDYLDLSFSSLTIQKGRKIRREKFMPK